MTTTLLNELIVGVDISANVIDQLSLQISADDCLPSCFKTTELASSSLMVAACALAEFTQDSQAVSRISVNNRLASLWFDQSLVPLDWQLSGLWDSIAGNYACADAWIRLHTNAPHHKQAALKVLQCGDSKQSVAAALSSWNADELEQSIIEAGGCAATMRSIDAWQQHPQGAAVACEPLIHWQDHGEGMPTDRDVTTNIGAVHGRPLSGVRVLDLTRVLAGPVSTRFLAAYGADVLRIDPSNWDEPGVVPEVTLGKRCAHLDLKTDTGRDQFLSLLGTADVLVHGYRPGAMAGLGLSDAVLREHNPALINVSLNAYGWSGPWSQRRGFDSLVQMSSGISHEGMLQLESDKPHPLPVQALDHATGCLMAAAALHALSVRRKTGRVLGAKMSLARTAHVLQKHRQELVSAPFESVHNSDLHPDIETTPWGDAQRVRFPIELNEFTARWDRPACALRSVPAQWLDRH